MTADEKQVATTEKVKELEDQRENCLQAVHNGNISACHDMCMTLKNIKMELENPHKWTGTAILMVATQSSVDAFGDTIVHYSNQRVQQFIENTVGATLEDTALRIEAYCVSGVQGVVENQLSHTLRLKGQLTSLIISKLQETAQRANHGIIKSMNYKNFTGAITVKYGIIAENWATKFENPSRFSHLETEIGLRVWEAGTTRFHALTTEEWRAWLDMWHNPSTTSSPSTGLAAHSTTNPSNNDGRTEATLTSTTLASVETADSTENAMPAENTISTESATHTGALPAAQTITLTPANAVPEKRTATDTELTAPLAKHVHTGPMAINFINSVTPAVGETFNILKATQKKCSDAGVPHGPRKKPANAPSKNVPPMGATPTVQPSKSRSRRGKQAGTAESATNPA